MSTAPRPDTASLVEDLAHRKCWRYRHSSDPAHSSTYTFNRATLLDFADALLAAVVRDGQQRPAQATFAGWFRELPSSMNYRLWEQGGHEATEGGV
jgi:hypothetical protein